MYELVGGYGSIPVNCPQCDYNTPKKCYVCSSMINYKVKSRKCDKGTINGQHTLKIVSVQTEALF